MSVADRRQPAGSLTDSLTDQVTGWLAARRGDVAENVVKIPFLLKDPLIELPQAGSSDNVGRCNLISQLDSLIGQESLVSGSPSPSLSLPLTFWLFRLLASSSALELVPVHLHESAKRKGVKNLTSFPLSSESQILQYRYGFPVPISRPTYASRRKPRHGSPSFISARADIRIFLYSFRDRRLVSFRIESLRNVGLES